jgi:hypothetical protein
MQWVKSRPPVKYNLAASGVMNYPLAKLPVNWGELELTGDSFYGYKPLQEALARHCGVPQEQVFAATGTSGANHIAMAALASPGDEILVEEPTYELIVTAAQYLGLSVKRFPRPRENDFQIDIPTLEQAVSKKTTLIVLSNLHNPTSAYTDGSTLRKVGEIARSVGAKVLVDEVYLDAHFEQAPRSSIHLGKEFVVTSSLTKVYGLGGLRCGWVLAEPDLVRKMWLINDLHGNIPAHIAERLSVLALQHLGEIREWSRSLLLENQKSLRELFTGREHVNYFAPGFGTIVFPRLRGGRVGEFCDFLVKKYQTSITPGKFFDAPDHFRLGLVGKPELVREGLTNLCRALDEWS